MLYLLSFWFNARTTFDIVPEPFVCFEIELSWTYQICVTQYLNCLLILCNIWLTLGVEATESLVRFCKNIIDFTSKSFFRWNILTIFSFGSLGLFFESKHCNFHWESTAPFRYQNSKWDLFKRWSTLTVPVVNALIIRLFYPNLYLFATWRWDLDMLVLAKFRVMY